MEQLGVSGNSAVAVKNRKNKKGSFYYKFNLFMNKNWLYFASPLLIFSVFFAILFSMGIYPFGKNNISNYDLLAQIVPFYEHFYDVLEGKSGLFYSPAIAGGADVFGTLAYCAVSPFTFLFLLFGKTQVYNAISFILPLKLACISCSAIYFIRKLFKNIGEYQTLTISIVYAFTGYMLVANTYVNWLDFMIYMPFVLIGFKKLVEEKKILYFGISYALMIYACFSIACFALFIIFLMFFAYVIFSCKSGERREMITKMCLSLVVAVSIALPLIVPAFFAYIRSGRSTGLFENMDNALSTNHLKIKLTYVFSNSLFLFCAIVYFFKSKFKGKNDKFLFISGILIMMPVLIDEICNLLNAGSYMSYALRFGFLNSAYGLYMTSKLVNDIKSEKVSKTKNIAFTALFSVLCVGAIAFILVVNNRIMNCSDETIKAIYDFSGKFAHSVATFEVTFIICAVLFALFIVFTVIVKYKLADFKIISYALIVVLAVQVVFYNIHLVYGNSFNPLRYDQYNAIVSKLDEYDDRLYYRIKDNNKAITNDAALNTHTNSYGVFSSVIDNDNFVATNFFNYEGNKINSIEGAGGTFFGDCLLGYKYFYVHTDDKRPAYLLDDKRYAVKLEETAQANFCAYENTAVFPNCFVSDCGEMQMSGNEVRDMQSIYRFIGGKGELFVTSYFSDDYSTGLNIIGKKTNDYTGETVYILNFYTGYTGEYYVETDFPEEYEIYYNTNASDDPLSLNYNKKLDGSIHLGYSKESSSYYHINLKCVGDKQIDAQLINQCVKGMVLPNEKVFEISQSLRQRACDYKITRNNFTVDAYSDSADNYLILNYVSIKGFEATVNGHRAEVVDNGLKFICVKLDEGENHVVISYHSPYYKYIAVGLILGAIALTAVFLIVKKLKGKPYKVFETVISGMAVLLAVGIFAFFFAYPGSLFVSKLAKLIVASI